MWDIYEDTLEALATYRQKPTDSQWQHFANLRGSLLTQMSYFGDLLRAYKRVALQGGSTSNTIMKLLAYVPMSVREMLNELPQRIDVLNEVLKGEEVISNVGRVAKKSANDPLLASSVPKMTMKIKPLSGAQSLMTRKYSTYPYVIFGPMSPL